MNTITMIDEAMNLRVFGIGEDLAAMEQRLAAAIERVVQRIPGEDRAELAKSFGQRGLMVSIRSTPAVTPTPGQWEVESRAIEGADDAPLDRLIANRLASSLAESRSRATFGLAENDAASIAKAWGFGAGSAAARMAKIAAGIF